MSLLWLCLAAAAPAQDLAAIQKRGALRVILERHMQAERFSNEPGAEPGLEREILQGFAALHKLRLETVVVDRTEDRMSYLVEGKGDVVVGIVVTEARRKQAAFTSEVLPIRHVVVTRKPDPPVDTIAALRARRVGATKGSSWAEMARQAGVPEANIDDSFAAPDSCLEALRARKVSAVIMSTAWAVVARHRDPELELGTFVGPPTTAAFAVRHAAPQLLASLDDYVINVRRTSTWSRLVVKYFHESGLEILKRSRPDEAATR
ncbi:MAG TPA: transporter substrate-binding domain-containing protein [Vicinamibacteria bacterium]